MKILFIGVYSNEDTKTKLEGISNNEGQLSVAAIKYTRLIGEGLKYNIGNNSTNLFLVPIGMYPVCKIFLWDKRKIDGDHYIPFINLLILKQLTIALYVSYFSLKWYFNNKGNGEKIIVFSFLYLPFLIAVTPLRLLSKILITSFVPDLPEYENSYSETKYSLKKLLIPVYIILSKNLVQINDFFIYITKYMNNRIGKKPYLIIEGFTDAKIKITYNYDSSEKKAIMYAGALFEKFGIKLLMDAFHEIKGDYELWLFGNGDMEKEIELFSLKDTRIKYWGNRSNDEIIAFEKKAKLLVNPRFTDNEFTKYSFPSKLMEYMASGTPVLTTKLLGIPEEYFDKMYYIESETTKGLKQALLNCLTKPQKELDLFGENTKLYILKEKNNNKQIERLIDVLETQFLNVN